jgi:hypothetical protein
MLVDGDLADYETPRSRLPYIRGESVSVDRLFFPADNLGPFCLSCARTDVQFPPQAHAMAHNGIVGFCHEKHGGYRALRLYNRLLQKPKGEA